MDADSAHIVATALSRPLKVQVARIRPCGNLAITSEPPKCSTVCERIFSEVRESVAEVAGASPRGITHERGPELQGAFVGSVQSPQGQAWQPRHRCVLRDTCAVRSVSNGSCGVGHLSCTRSAGLAQAAVEVAALDNPKPLYVARAAGVLGTHALARAVTRSMKNGCGGLAQMARLVSRIENGVRAHDTRNATGGNGHGR